MSLVNLKFRAHSIPVNCDDEQKIRNLSERLNQKIEESSFKHTTDTKALYLVALTMQDELENSKNSLKVAENKIHEQVDDHEEIINNTLNFVSEFIEDLAEKLEKR